MSHNTDCESRVAEWAELVGASIPDAEEGADGGTVRDATEPVDVTGTFAPDRHD